MKLKHNVPSLLKLVLKMKLYLQEELQVIATRFEQKIYNKLSGRKTSSHPKKTISGLPERTDWARISCWFAGFFFLWATTPVSLGQRKFLTQNLNLHLHWLGCSNFKFTSPSQPRVIHFGHVHIKMQASDILSGCHINGFRIGWWSCTMAIPYEVWQGCKVVSVNWMGERVAGRDEGDDRRRAKSSTR